MKFRAILAFGIVASLGATLWMRQVASWRPHVVARLNVKWGNMTLSRDGRRMLVWGIVPRPAIVKTVVLDLESETIVTNGHPVRDFWKRDLSPLNLHLNKSQTQLIFTPASGPPVLLEGKIFPLDSDFDARGEGASDFVYFKSRSEIYREGFRELHIWDSRTGSLKSHLHGWQGDLSPDGLSVLRSTYSPPPQGANVLIVDRVPSGKSSVIYRAKPGARGYTIGDSGWSPDGQFIWFIRQNPKMQYLDFNVVRAADSKPLWSAPCAGPSWWLPDGRIGLMQRDGFSLRDASGREIGRASGPLPGKSVSPFGRQDWEASPDGKWIYDIDDSNGTIRRWRAK